MQYELHGEGKPHQKIATSLHQLGCVLQAQGDLAGAQEKLETSLAMEYELHGKDKPHPDIAAILHALGGVLQAQGDLAGAQEKSLKPR